MTRTGDTTNHPSLKPWPTITVEAAQALNPPNFRFSKGPQSGEPLNIEFRMWRGQNFWAVPEDSLLYRVVACRSERGEKGSLPEYPIPVAAFKKALEKVVGCPCEIQDEGCLYLHPSLEVRESKDNTVIAPNDLRYQAAWKAIMMQPTTRDRVVNSAVRVGAAALVIEPVTAILGSVIGASLLANDRTGPFTKRILKTAAEGGLGRIESGFRMADLARVNNLIERSWKLGPPPESTEPS